MGQSGFDVKVTWAMVNDVKKGKDYKGKDIFVLVDKEECEIEDIQIKLLPGHATKFNKVSGIERLKKNLYKFHLPKKDCVYCICINADLAAMDVLSILNYSVKFKVGNKMYGSDKFIWFDHIGKFPEKEIKTIRTIVHDRIKLEELTKGN